jgi:hypothetical protein
METDLRKIEILAEERENENYRFRVFLKGLDMSDRKLDSIVRKITRRVSGQIDCRTCRNCCKHGSPTVTESDIRKMAKYLNLSPKEFRKRYVTFNEFEAQDALLFPCPFFKQNRCVIEDAMPEMCRTYPYLLKSNFRGRLLNVVSNYGICPIVFNVYEELKHVLWHR